MTSSSLASDFHSSEDVLPSARRDLGRAVGIASAAEPSRSPPFRLRVRRSSWTSAGSTRPAFARNVSPIGNDFSGKCLGSSAFSAEERWLTRFAQPACAGIPNDPAIWQEVRPQIERQRSSTNDRSAATQWFPRSRWRQCHRQGDCGLGRRSVRSRRQRERMSPGKSARTTQQRCSAGQDATEQASSTRRRRRSASAQAKGEQAAGCAASLSDQLQALAEWQATRSEPLTSYLGDARQRVIGLASTFEQRGPQGVLDDVARICHAASQACSCS